MWTAKTRGRIAAIEKKTKRYPTDPTDAEWEHGCRAGTKMKYHSGNKDEDLLEYAWFEKNSDGRTHAVGEKKPNGWGLYDMGGLAWEWCEDVWHDNYEGAPRDGSAWNADNNRSPRVTRGGSWNFGAEGCRCASRGKQPPDACFWCHGFRVARSSGE